MAYPKAGEGYLFHDSENNLDFAAIQKPLWILSDLYEGCSAVVAIRVDPQTIMATFNADDFPRPRKFVLPQYPKEPLEYEYLAKSRLSGWVLSNIKDPGSEPTALVFDDVYDECLRLERFTGNCPCSALQEGTCFPTTVFAKFPGLELRKYQGIDTSVYKRTRYEKIVDFEYVSGVYSVNAEFQEAIRPWDNYDFSLIPKRKHKFEDRAAESSRRHGHRKVECEKCVFATKQYGYSQTLKDCGQINDCEAHVLEETAWKALFHWLESSTHFTTGCEGFSLKEIRYLIHQSGLQTSSRAITHTKTTDTVLAGFCTRRSGLEYKVVPGRGNLDRRRHFSSYAALRAEIKTLPAASNVPDVQLDPKHVLAHAIFTTTSTIRGNGHQPHPSYAITHEDDGIVLKGHTSKSVFRAAELYPASSVMAYYRELWPARFPEANKLAESYWVDPYCR